MAKKGVVKDSEAARIGARIAAARDRLGLSNEELGQRIGLALPSVKKLVGGEASTNFAKLITIAKALNTSPNELLGFEANASFPAEQLRGVLEALLASQGVEESRIRKLTAATLRALQAPSLPGYTSVDSPKARLATELDQAGPAKPS